MSNRNSPGDSSFTPNMQFSCNQFTFDNTDSSTPSFSKAMSSPPPSLNPGDSSRPAMYLFHKSFKSRVETQIPIRLILSPLPPGIKKLRLPPYTVAKPKFYAKSEVENSPDTYELQTSLVCTSAMQDPKKHDRALARARGEESRLSSRPSPASSSDSQSSKDEGDKPLNGGEVKICSGCIARERKRNSRKKTKKPEEEELFQKDEEKRVIVFNTNEIKDWHEPSFEEDDPKTGRRITVPAPNFVPGSMQVDLPMRIACYCRHQHEKLGFIVIFTIRDCNNNVIAQGETQSIMITDDHKTNNMPPQIPTPTSSMPPNSQFPGSGVFPASALDRPGGPPMEPRPFRTSLSTTDLSGLQSNFDPQYPVSNSSNPFAIPNPMSVATSATLTPKNLSRPPSPSGVPGPNTKRRKHSGSGKVPTNLTMTRLETSQPAATSNAMSNPPLTSPFTPQGPSYPPDRSFVMPMSRSNQVTTSPPTPNSNSDFGFMTAASRSFSMENLPRQAMMSAPSSRQPSRPGSPTSNRNSYNQVEAVITHAMAPQPYTQSRRPLPLIHKLIPTEGSVTGGTEVSLLGNGFYQGLEVMFGDTEATTTTFWGEKSLTCLTPPALQPGTVAVVFKHEHPMYSQRPRQPQQRSPIFNYTDDSENEMLRLALRTLGPSLPQPTADPMTAAQQLLGGPSTTAWLMQNNYGGGPHHQASASRAAEMLELETNMVRFLDILDTLTKFRPRLDLGSSTGQTLLHLASYMGLTRLVVGLLTRGANLNSLDKNGNTPMHLAALNGHHHIVHRLRLAGADNRIRSLRNYLPADMASSRQARLAALLPPDQYRSRSAGGTPLRLQSRNASLTSLSSLAGSLAISSTVEDTSDSSDREVAPETFSIPFRPASDSQKPSRRPSIHDFRRLTSSSTQSRRSSGNELSNPRMLPNPDTIDDASALVSPAAYMMAWRDQLAAQIQQYQQNAQRFLPNLPTLPNLPQLPQLPGLPDYQTNPMVRRVSSLFPQRAPSRPPIAQSNKESWWESLTGSPPASVAPPAYEDLYPDRENEEDFSLKKESSIRALADAALDQHFESSSSTEVALPQPRPSSAVRRLQQQNRMQFEGREVKPLRKDSTLHFFWVCSKTTSYFLQSNPFHRFRSLWSYLPFPSGVLSLIFRMQCRKGISTFRSTIFELLECFSV